MRNEHSDQPDHFLHGAVRMIEKRSFLMHGELVGISCTWRHRFLADPRHAILFDGNLQTMPVQRSTLGKRVIENDPYAIALRDLNGRPWAIAVIAPDIDGLERHDFLLQRLRF